MSKKSIRKRQPKQPAYDPASAGLFSVKSIEIPAPAAFPKPVYVPPVLPTLPLAPEPDFYDRTHAYFAQVQAELHKELEGMYCGCREDLAPLVNLSHAVEEYLLSRMC